MGHLLTLLGDVNERTIQKYQRDAEKIGKGSFAYAWVLDETEEERDRLLLFIISSFKINIHLLKWNLINKIFINWNYI